MSRNAFVKTADGMKSTGTYNPNTFNALDAAICFIVFLVAEFAIDVFLSETLGNYIKNDPNYDYYLVLLIGGIVPQILMVAIALSFCRLRRVGFLTGGGFIRRFDGVNVLFAIMLTLGVQLVFQAVHFQFGDDLFRVLYNTDMNAYNDALQDKVQGNYLFYLFYAYVVSPFVPAVIEEAVWRGVIMRGLTQIGSVFAIVVSGLMFALMHGNFYQFVLQFVFGMLVAAVVLLTRNFFVGMAMNFANNLFVMLLAVAQNYAAITVGANAEYLFDAFTIVIGLTFLAVSAVYFIKMLTAKTRREALGEREATLLADERLYALIDSGEVDDEGEPVFEKRVWTDVKIADFKDAGKAFSYNGVVAKMNKKGSAVAAYVLLAVGVAAAVAVILFY